jgi:uncharacterized protein YukJ
MSNLYCMFKGTLKAAAPYFDTYPGSPHYVISIASDQATFNIVVNSASTAESENDDSRVYSFVDLHFQDAICQKLASLGPGLHTDSFPKLDYWQDQSLLDIKRMRLVPYKDEDGSRFDINDQIDDLLTIDETAPSQLMPYSPGGGRLQRRKFWYPKQSDVIVYGFGFLFLPEKDGLHETHMNQGNPVDGGHARENGVFQDGALIVQRNDSFSAAFTAFQSQRLSD